MDYSIKLPISEDFNSSNGVIYVRNDSLISQKEALEMMALYFKREFKFDHLQYCKDDHTPDCTGILFVERAMDKVKDINHHPHRVIGGACFRAINTNSTVLDWIWLHPFARNRKNLKKHWSKFQEKFGHFTLTPPLSAQMEKFIEKNT